jgi:carboxypeptidase C (cathepsin A)
LKNTPMQTPRRSGSFSVASFRGIFVVIGVAIAATSFSEVPSPTQAVAESAKPSLQELRTDTRHVARIGGQRLDYTAITGTLTLSNDTGKPIASMFYVAYLLEPRSARRPLTFFYNGGPGSSTMWLHMSSFGPRRVVLNVPNPSANPPHQIVDNDDSLLAKSDLVFLDAINTGYSRPLGDATAASFLAADPDIDSFARAIERFLTLQARWNSPKFLFGESYGTSRSAGLVDRLQKDGAQMNGIIQLGCVLDVSRLLTRGDRTYMAELPTFAMTAAYHEKIPHPGDRSAFIKEVTGWTEGAYARALAAGDDLSADERQATAQQMARYTGLDTRFILEHDLRVTPDLFRAELLRDRRKLLGELDTRFAGDVGEVAETASYDPSATGVFRVIIAGWNDYVRTELNFSTDLSYRRAYPNAWDLFDFRRANRKSNDAYYGTDLAEAMTSNPHLLVFWMNGVYDLSTAFYGAEYDFRHLRIPESRRTNVESAYYDAGHMAYVDSTARQAMAQDIRRFYDKAALH